MSSPLTMTDLATTGRRTTRLGFGCSSIMGAVGRRESLRLLDAAFAAGIRHFDVAPSYGYGQAEAVLGEFLSQHRGDVTVTTKYGIPAASQSRVKAIIRGAVRPLLKAMPQLKAAAKKGMQPAPAARVSSVARHVFRVEEARLTLERSLRALRTERVDVWLLHEAESVDLHDDRLLEFMQGSVREGKIGTFGVGSEAHKTGALLQERPAYCPVVQCEWSVLDDAIGPSDAFRIHHRALTAWLGELHAQLNGNREKRTAWSSRTGVDVGDRHALAGLMLKAALELNPASVILVSSKDPANINRNAEVSMDPGLAAPARQLYELLHETGTSWGQV